MSPQTQFCFSLLRASQGKKIYSDCQNLLSSLIIHPSPLKLHQFHIDIFVLFGFSEGSIWACKIFSWRCFHAGAGTKIVVGEWNFQWKSSGKLPTMCLQKLWDWTPGKIFENCLCAEKLQLMKAGSCWILQKDLKKGRRSQGTMSWAAPPKAEILNGVQRCTELCLGFSRREVVVGYSPAKQNHQSDFFWERLLHSVGSFSLLWSAVQRTQHTLPVQVFQNYAKSISVTLTAFYMSLS